MALLLCGGGLVGCAPRSAGEETRAASGERAVAAVAMLPRDLSQELRMSGPLEPLREVRLAARMTGVLAEVPFEEGARVAAGDVLARFDLSEQQAELERARALAEQAEAGYARVRSLRGRDLVSAAEHEEARALRRVAASEALLWETRLAFGTVVASLDGLLVARRVEAGEAVSAGEPLFVLADVSTLVVRVGVSDRFAPRIGEGDRVEVWVDADPGRPREGRVRRVFPAADPASRLVPVEVALADAEPDLLRPGFLARLRLDVDRRAGVMAVPNEALLASSPGAPFVFVIEDERLVRRDVEVGVSRRDWTEVTAGLEPGEQVVGSNPANLRPGARVRVTARLTHASDPRADEAAPAGAR